MFLYRGQKQVLMCALREGFHRFITTDRAAVAKCLSARRLQEIHEAVVRENLRGRMQNIFCGKQR